VTTRIHQIKQAAVRMAHLTREMLAYYGYGTFNVTRVDLGSLIREMSDLLATASASASNSATSSRRTRWL